MIGAITQFFLHTVTQIYCFPVSSSVFVRVSHISEA